MADLVQLPTAQKQVQHNNNKMQQHQQMQMLGKNKEDHYPYNQLKI